MQSKHEEKVNHFGADLAFSLTPRLDDEISEVIRESLSATQVIDISETAIGKSVDVDKLCVCAQNRIKTVEVKLRRQIWPDILLELWSNRERGVPGWLFLSKADYLFYGFTTSSRIKYVLFDLSALKKWWEENKLRNWPLVPAVNQGYTTVSAAVPLAELGKLVLQETVSKVMIDEFC